MDNGWRTALLGDVLEELIDHRGRTPKKLGGDFTTNGARVISAKNVREGRLDLSFEARFVSDEMYAQWMKVPLQRGDVLLTSEAPMGEVAYLNGEHRFCLGQRLFALRAAREQLDGRFLYYWLRSRSAQARLRARLSGTTAQGIRQSQLVQVEVPVPPLDEQQRIAGVLGALDDKVEQNQVLRDRLVDAGHSLYRSLLQKTSVKVGDVADLVKGLSYKGTGLVAGGLPMFNLANFALSGWAQRNGLKFYDGEYRDRHVVKTGDLLIANTDLTQRREILGRPLLVPAGFDKALFTHHLFAIRFFADFQDYRLLLYFALQEREFRDRAETFASGTTVAALPRDAVMDYEFNAAEPEHVTKFASRAETLVSRAWQCEDENTRLTAIRDSLLPKVVSGQLHVSRSYDPYDALGALEQPAVDP
jgi:type I restriction enzyme, S subunit